MKRRIKINPQLLISYGVLFTSLGALSISYQQANIMNKQTDVLLEQTKASAWPHLNIDLSRSYSENGADGYKIFISNKGTGPAIIEGVKIKYDDKLIKRWTELYKYTSASKSMMGHNNSRISNKVLASNEYLKLIEFVKKKFIEHILDNGEKLSVEICYKSVYGDTWSVIRKGFKTNLESSEKKKIDFCSIPNNEMFIE